ncbi:MAG: glycosyl transferase family 2 [Paenibacillus sp.]|jgi:hypothetical protein|nr:glycosyl transferase family 2 [Paenibacillus sp.]
MIVFVLDSHNLTAAQQTKSSLDTFCPEWDVILIETSPALTMNQAIMSCSDPFFMTLYAGEMVTRSFIQKLVTHMERLPSRAAGILIKQIGTHRCHVTNRMDRRGPILWRLEALSSGPIAGFATQDEFPFESYVLLEMQYRLNPAWEWDLIETDEWQPSQVVNPRWQQPEKEWECLYPILAAQTPIRPSGVPPEVTIVICTYNNRDYIRWAIRSVMAQTCPNWELIIVNDASEDDTLQLLHDVSHPFVHVFNNMVNGGKSKCLNQVLPYVQGNWLLELDADDWLEPNCIEKLLEHAVSNHEIGAIYADHTEWYERTNKQLIYKQIIRSMSDFTAEAMLRCSMPLAPRMYRVHTLKLIGGWMTSDPFEGRIYEDFQILLRISLRQSVQHVKMPLYHRRLRNNSITHLMNGKYEVWKAWIEQNICDPGREDISVLPPK